MNTNYVSIILCHYADYDDFGEERRRGGPDRSSMLKVTLESLIDNTNYPSEIIVMDNGGKNKDDSDYLLGLARNRLITYVRYPNNMNFAYAWNQGAKIATGDFLCFTCNDIQFSDGWLKETIAPLLKYPDKKLIASPLVTPDKDKDKYNKGYLNKHRLNSLAGSNCMVMKKEVFGDIGEFLHAPSGGTYWHRTMAKRGYRVVLPPKNKAFHLGFKGGVDFFKEIKVVKTLLNGEQIDFTHDTSPMY